MTLPALLLLAATAQQGMMANSPASQPAVVVGPSTPRIVAPQPPQPKVVRPPQERGSAQSLFSPDDYPPAAGGRRGSVGVILTVDPQGRVTGCEVTRSSGSAALDTATCNLLRRRERFTPAIDSNGSPAIGRVPVQIDWDAVFRDVRVIRGN
jgi:periplasmic protein TonB